MKTRILTILLLLTLLLAAAVPAAAAQRTLCVDYNLRSKGISFAVTSEAVLYNSRPTRVPRVLGLDGRTFMGWSRTDPDTLKSGEIVELVDPNQDRIRTDTVYYAVYSDDSLGSAQHERYVVGYPDGTFRPDAPIDRASVATIIARAALTGFQEGADYGNPLGYTDVEGHWAASAIAFCSAAGVFNGYEDGTFRPDDPITRQDFALAVARLAGVLGNRGLPFPDADQVSPWAVDGVYTAYVKGWMTGDDNGLLRPLDNIRRVEAVKLFNGYLGRGVDPQGLESVSGYFRWPDVPKDHWAFYQVLEAGNNHIYRMGTLPEHWLTINN